MAKEKTQKIQRTEKGTHLFVHDLFKAKKAEMLKNTSWRKVAASHEVLRVEHSHIYHSYDSNGKEQAACLAVGNHFHHIKRTDSDGNVLVDAQGKPRVECGPPMRHQSVKLPNGKIQKKEIPVKIEMEDGTVITDSHTHIFDYQHSEELSPNKIQQLKRSNAQGIMNAFQGAPQAKGNEPEASEAITE